MNERKPSGFLFYFYFILILIFTRSFYEHTADPLLQTIVAYNTNKNAVELIIQIYNFLRLSTFPPLKVL